LEVLSKLTLTLSIPRIDRPQFLQVPLGELIRAGIGVAGVLALVQLSDEVFGGQAGAFFRKSLCQGLAHIFKHDFDARAGLRVGGTYLEC